MLNTWILFENDHCDACRSPKYGKITDQARKDTLTFIISCDCDSAVFKDEWKRQDSADLIVVLHPDGCNETLRAMAQWMSEKK